LADHLDKLKAMSPARQNQQLRGARTETISAISALPRFGTAQAEVTKPGVHPPLPIVAGLYQRSPATLSAGDTG